VNLKQTACSAREGKSLDARFVYRALRKKKIKKEKNGSNVRLAVVYIDV